MQFFQGRSKSTGDCGNDNDGGDGTGFTQLEESFQAKTFWSWKLSQSWIIIKFTEFSGKEIFELRRNIEARAVCHWKKGDHYRARICNAVSVFVAIFNGFNKYWIWENFLYWLRCTAGLGAATKLKKVLRPPPKRAKLWPGGRAADRPPENQSFPELSWGNSGYLQFSGRWPFGQSAARFMVRLP